MRTLVVLALLLMIGVPVQAETCSLPGLEKSRSLIAPSNGTVTRGARALLPEAGVPAMGGQATGQYYAGEDGSWVRTPQAGVVVFAGRAGPLGEVVQIAHGDGFETLYANLRSTVRTEGECVEPSAIIGTLGCSSTCSKSELYFELSRFGETLDPDPFLRDPGSTSYSNTSWAAVDRGALIDVVVATVEARFLDKSLLERIGWKEKVAAKRQSIIEAPSAQEAVAAINDLISQLQTSHTRLFTPDDHEYYILPDINGQPKRTPGSVDFKGMVDLVPRYPGIGIFTQLIGGQHFIDGVLEGSPADKAGLMIGDEVLRVDDEPFSPIAVFQGKVGKSVRLEVRRQPDGTPEGLEVPVSWIEPGASFQAATEASGRVIEEGSKRIGYIHVWAFNGLQGFERALSKFEGTAGSKPIDGLVIDVRGKVGGHSGAVQQMLALLDAPSKPYWGRWTTSDKATWHSANRVVPSNARDGEGRGPRPVYRGRTTLLIDHHTRSAGEIFAYAFKRNGFGRVFGTTTAGAVVTGATYVMPGGLLLYLAEVGHFFDGVPLEGSGVNPDQRVARPLAFAHGADPVLKLALEALVEGDH